MTSWFEDPLLWIHLVVLVAAVFAVTRDQRTDTQLRANDDAQHGDGASVRGRLTGSLTEATPNSAVATLAEERPAPLDGLRQRYGDDNAVLADLMLIDHTGSQFSRRTNGIGLCGGWIFLIAGGSGSCLAVSTALDVDMEALSFGMRRTVGALTKARSATPRRNTGVDA